MRLSFISFKAVIFVSVRKQNIKSRQFCFCDINISRGKYQNFGKRSSRAREIWKKCPSLLRLLPASPLFIFLRSLFTQPKILRNARTPPPYWNFNWNPFRSSPIILDFVFVLLSVVSRLLLLYSTGSNYGAARVVKIVLMTMLGSVNSLSSFFSST